MTDVPNSGVGRHRVRPTRLGWAVIIGGVLVVYTGLTSATQTLGGLIALIIVGLADAIFSYIGLRANSVTVVPARVGGSPEQPPTVRARHATSRTTVLLRLHSLVFSFLKHPCVPIAPGATRVLSWDGTHPIAARQFAWDLTATKIGLCAASRSHYQATHSLVFRGPALPDKPVDLPAVTSREDLSILREYVPGDRMGRVNWSATARTTNLYVRDSGGADEETVIVLMLCPNTDSRDLLVKAITQALVNTRSLGEQILGLGRPLRLISTEFPSVQEEMAKAQARTIQPRLPAPEPYGASIVVDAAVNDQTELLRRLAIAEPTFDEPAFHGPHIRVSLDGVEVR